MTFDPLSQGIFARFTSNAAPFDTQRSGIFAVSASSLRPQTLELDAHSQQFFEPAYWRGDAQAKFRLDVESLKDKIFIGCAALFCDERLHLVMREEGDANAPVLVAMLPLPLQPTDRTLWPIQIAGYFETHLTKNDKDGEEKNEFVPTLQGMGTLNGLIRLHFDSLTGIGLSLHPQGVSLLDLRDEGQLHKGEWPYIEIANALFDYLPQTDPLRAFIHLEQGHFHERVDYLMRSGDETLGCEARFFAMNEEERSRYAFGCDRATLKWAKELLRLALLAHMGAGGGLTKLAVARWHPFARDENIQGADATGFPAWEDVPPSLEVKRELIFARLGCLPNAEILDDETGLHTLASDWIREFEVKAKRASAHERIEAALAIQEALDTE